MATVSLRNIEKIYSSFHAVRGINLSIEENAFVVLVGPSGCGKSTTLRMIAGLEDISKGELLIGDEVVNDMPPGERNIAMVFQNYALYPHMTVQDNIAFGLKQRKCPKDERNRRVAEVAGMLELDTLLERKPRALSGGQRQRVAMARAMVRNPEVFLFDEPLSNLDAKLRVQMRTEIKRIHQVRPTTTIYVTHDQIEAMTLADQVVVMNKGLIEQVGAPQELYHRPATKFVATFIGSPATNLFEVRVVTEGEACFVELETGARLEIPESRKAVYRQHANRQMLLGIRPEHLQTASLPDTASPLTVDVDVVEPLGLETFVYFRHGKANCCARIAPTAEARPKQPFTLYPDMTQAHLIDPQTERVVTSEFAAD
ncbi:sn-glycerol-3-phosphate ABC transporter ATP-binding protein UgpC [uncultured Cohaesibacter sp.]|uniref:ABC transporter ATP-binding protein n=1 Tax=uncultured Cohaesibacter sp. TaxID=1002546 RepID=UPI00292DF3FD|nr:sn-glycerol-3-phosphate ABC transporter ATP-binding protein UgpC [uncultured Cohaesibacter sp.]